METGTYRDRVIDLASACLQTLHVFEAIARRLHPRIAATLRERVDPLAKKLGAARSSLHETTPPRGWEPLAAQLDLAAGHAVSALESFGSPDAGPFGVLGAFRTLCRAQEALFPLRRVLVPVGRFFAEPALHDRLDLLEPEPTRGVETGFFPVPAPDGAADGRGGGVLYVPETYDGSRDWPLVVALHGGYGHGRDFLWTWVREVRSRAALLLSPTSLDATWSFDAPERDLVPLLGQLDWVAERVRVDPDRRLLTGLSDGATYSLLAGLGEGSPFDALAPVSGVLHPANLDNGNLARARGRRIRLVHGTLDWMFPVQIARAAAQALEGAGAELVYREIEDLPHAYPREENAPILEWWDPTRVTLAGT